MGANSRATPKTDSFAGAGKRGLLRPLSQESSTHPSPMAAMVAMPKYHSAHHRQRWTGTPWPSLSSPTRNNKGPVSLLTLVPRSTQAFQPSLWQAFTLVRAFSRTEANPFWHPAFHSGLHQVHRRMNPSPGQTLSRAGLLISGVLLQLSDSLLLPHPPSPPSFALRGPSLTIPSPSLDASLAHDVATSVSTAPPKSLAVPSVHVQHAYSCFWIRSVAPPAFESALVETARASPVSSRHPYFRQGHRLVLLSCS